MKPKDPLRASPNPSIQAPESALHPARELALKHHGVFHSDALSMPSLCFMSQTCSTITRSKRIFLFKDEILSAGTTLEPEASVWVSGIANSYQSGENWRHSTVLLLTQRLWSQILAQTWDHLGKKKKIHISATNEVSSRYLNSNGDKHNLFHSRKGENYAKYS